ncbi:hypothetical protein BGW36DRAFT_406791 [Talaromyces proteolyticus]|uniref:ubiquitinyl hydrolase 1 n=1 Tax=Talaromyces proteolyticus TaxID=1131652 RepID=A0AAD4KTE3_9EURO|nr:uncharacterized protein BGW36DRAFT_406791 [Talaromyces proteolyticus]KAH8698926.1 hypothetical protein BGW36DRAFT_406791 [Talaromyces proteolyticus]
MSMKSPILRLIYNHVAFPPNLPGTRDSDEETISVHKDLITRLIDAISILKQNANDETLDAWQLIEASLRSCLLLHANGFINKEGFLNALGNFHSGTSIILYLELQNACLFIRRSRQNRDDEEIVFEAFETSPTAKQTLASKGALQWDFPGIAVSVPLHEFEDSVFRDSLSTFIEKASIETIDEFVPKTQKTGTMISEHRDTTDPAIITQFLMTVLEVNGNSINPPLLRKRIRDDVCWDKAELPWRRSPFWLVLRVCIQRLLYLHLGSECGRVQYKSLISIFLAKLLESSVYELEPEETNFLKAKLCRRLAKLELEIGKLDEFPGISNPGLSTKTMEICQKSIEITTRHSMEAWKSFKAAFKRQIPTLAQWAHDDDFRLRMPNSSPYLREVLNHKTGHLNLESKIAKKGLSNPNTKKTTTEQFDALTMKYSALADIEMSIETSTRDVPIDQRRQTQCNTVASEIESYFGAVGDAYEDNPEQMSIFILSLFEMWVHMDKCAIVAYPLLRNLHPWFEPELLDVLHLSRQKDFERLQEIQLYLLERGANAEVKETTILSDPSSGCLANLYIDSSFGNEIQKLQEKIDKASFEARLAKQAELDRVNARFQDLTERKAATSCTQRRRPDGTHDDRGCEYCYCVRHRYYLKIKVHEDFLPTDKNSAQKNAVLLELAMPESLIAYRNTTWNIIATICANSPLPNSGQPEKLLGDFTPLKQYNRHRNENGITLASRTKSYLGTHFKWKKLPARPQRIMFPFGMVLSYYDNRRKIWLKDFPRQLTLAHHFALKLPAHLPFSSLYSTSAFWPDKHGPSSYQTAASITECPSTLTVHEFVANKNLIGGRCRRWLSILAELGSSNINFSLLDTTYLFYLLAHQAGPRLESDVRRVVHVIFKDVIFCNRLIDQIGRHVDLISENWRESNYMETMLALTLQTYVLCCPEASTRAKEMLMKIRRITHTWISYLRHEMRNVQEVDIAEKAARYCFLSALLCRRTFLVERPREDGLDPNSLQCFIEATLAMQEALVVDISKFSISTRNMLIRDIKMAVALRRIIQDSVAKNSAPLSAAIDTVWPNTNNIPRVYSNWQVLPSPYDFWVTSIIEPTEYTVTQVVHYHLLEGHLLIDGQPIGKLPADIRDSEILKELFGNQRLVAFPSNMPNMRYVLSVVKEDNYIHIGYRNNELIVRAQRLGSIFELVPRHVFRGNNDFDLPEPLVENCVHWVELKQGLLHIRRHPRIWQGNAWEIDIIKKTGRRRQTALVDPHSRLFKSIARIFAHFEQPWMLTVCQPLNRTISVELKRMDLTFYVNRRNLLQCRQLAAEIDPYQDPGTFYGLQSMIVLRSIYNRMQRSIITPLGKVHYKRQGMHVCINIENDGSHARYGIDSVLGRLTSPAEPRLLYHKALLHALTSCFICDPLTGRNGTEEALASLQSGVCQPFVPLHKDRLEILRAIASLAPRRGYYPEHKQVQQTVHWNANLTTTIQNDAFEPVVDAIIAKSDRLSLFHQQVSEPPTDTPAIDGPPSTIPHLRQRAIWRRFLYERPGILYPEPFLTSDTKYISRDGRLFSSRLHNVREIVGLVKQRPNLVHTTKSLIDLLNQQPIIGGYSKAYSQSTLEDSLIANLFHEWGGLINLCIESQLEVTYEIMFQLGMVAFGKNADMTLLRTIASFFFLQDLKGLHPPPHSSFIGFEVNESPLVETLVDLMKPFIEVYTGPAGKKTKKKKQAAWVVWNQLSEERLEECKRFSRFLIEQWPCPEPSVGTFHATYISTSTAINAVIPEWRRLYHNLQLFSHIEDVQRILNRHFAERTNSKDPKLCTENELFGVSFYVFSIPRLGKDLMRQTGPKIDSHHALNWVDDWVFKEALPSTQPGQSRKPYLRAPETLELELITSDFTNSECPIQSSYGNDLNASIAALKMVEVSAINESSLDVEFVEGVRWLNGIINEARAVVDEMYAQITNSLVQMHPAYKWLHQGNLWPCMTPVTILEQLRSTSQCRFGRYMKEALIEYGLSIINLQRLMRLKEAFGKRDQAKLHDEYRNRGHVNWDPFYHSDWLLLEIDGNMQIREEQIIVAQEMIAPNSDSNSVLQMNMGKGKTSIIIPMIASALADGQTLSRIMVPKALLSQTAQILQARLGGLLGREITHIPFSRRTPTTTEIISEYRNLHKETLLNSGVILAVPEHVLSFKLSGLQRVSDSKINEAIEMVAIQRLIDETCRDVLDECDFTLAVKTQLIYPSGSQLALDGHPDRWGLIMTVLDILVHLLREASQDFPKSIDLTQHTYTEFPVVYFLRDDVEHSLINRLIDRVCFGQAAIFQIKDFTAKQREALKSFIGEERPNSTIVNETLTWLTERPKLYKSVHLLRGLFVHGILLLCLKKRWNVQYGLHPNRDPMAVPFHAKGVPSEQAEWGHPDVAILFTILAFYHEGLTVKQLRQSLQAVLRSDDPATEYDKWTQTSSTLPESLRHWNIINVDDEGQVVEIWHHLRRKIVIINYFLSHFVFPVHAKQFSIKMQASGWDIPLMQDLTALSSEDRKSQGLTTGFSGTNDNRRLMPLTIQQHDLPGLAHTNAEVLTYLLQDRNRRYIQAINTNKKRYSEHDLLARLKAEGIRILIDAGAFILEMGNRALVKAWLDEDRAQAAVYFGLDNKPWVQYQTGKTVPLIATPFVDNMENCLIYASAFSKGALTLGLNQTKDHTVQAAMRLRQLGTTQSVTFIAPPEVHQSIMDTRQRGLNLPIDSSDVLRWLLIQTCNSNKDLQPLYFAQGMDFCNRMQAAGNFKNFLTSSVHQEGLLKVLRCREHQTLEELYGPVATTTTGPTDCGPSTGPVLAPFGSKLRFFMQKLQESYKLTSLDRESARGSALEEVEQEREVAYEIEEERELQRPDHMKALKFPGLSRSIIEFVKTGILGDETECIKASFVLESTQLGKKHKIQASTLVSHLHVSPEFVRTVQIMNKEKYDSFIRPVNWFLWSRKSEQAVVIIPEEAEMLIPVLRSSPKSAAIHLILYAAPVTKNMLHFNRIDYYSLPSLPTKWIPPTWLPFEVGILAGRLYFEFSEYDGLLRQLKPRSDDLLDEEPDISSNNSSQTENFVGFLQEWLSLRRQGQDISHTPMGYLCQGLPLRIDHPFFSDIKVEEQGKKADDQFFTSTRNRDLSVNEDYYESDDEETAFAFEVNNLEDSEDEDELDQPLE